MSYAALAQRILSHADFRGSHPVLKERVEMQLFYADWCHHCTRLKPDWEKAAAGGKHVAVWTKIDCTNNRELARTYKIQSFPTIHRVFGNTRREFRAERTPEQMIQFAETGKHN